jgi:hypothetical protein
MALHVSSLRFLRQEMMYACGLRAVLWIEETRKALLTRPGLLSSPMGVNHLEIHSAFERNHLV